MHSLTSTLSEHPRLYHVGRGGASQPSSCRQANAPQHLPARLRLCAAVAPTTKPFHCVDLAWACSHFALAPNFSSPDLWTLEGDVSSCSYINSLFSSAVRRAVCSSSSSFSSSADCSCLRPGGVSHMPPCVAPLWPHIGGVVHIRLALLLVDQTPSTVAFTSRLSLHLLLCPHHFDCSFHNHIQPAPACLYHRHRSVLK